MGAHESARLPIFVCQPSERPFSRIGRLGEARLVKRRNHVRHRGEQQIPDALESTDDPPGFGGLRQAVPIPAFPGLDLSDEGLAVGRRVDRPEWAKQGAPVVGISTLGGRRHQLSPWRWL